MNIFHKLWLLGRFNKPAGALYLYWPCMWGTAAFSHSIY
jgi:4-hydroxybenzoate polyprenyl transferase